MSLTSLSTIGKNIVTYQGSSKVTISNKFLYYNMEQNPPTDQFGNGNDSVVNAAGCIVSTRAKYGSYSASSNGLANSTIYLYSSANNLSVGINVGITFSMWFYITAAITTGDCKIFEAAGDNKYFIRIPNSTSIFYWCDRGAPVGFTMNQWNHVVCTIDSGSNGYVYLNGVYQTSFTDAGRWTASLGRVFVCRSSLGSHNSIKGNIDDFRIYSKVLSQTEITAIYTNNDL